ncbi:MAG: AI-2E family transporter [Planctomycetota bacterium]|nr:AI-2E family transporter [Planctomycetota bacterium]
MTAQDSASTGPERRVQVICLLVIAAIATGAALRAMSDVMIPFALATFLAIALTPVVDGLAERTRLSRPLSVALTMLLGALLLAVVGGVVASSITDYNQRFGGPEVDAAVQEAGGEALNADEGARGPGQGALAGLVERLPEKLQGGVGDLTGKLESLLPGLVALLGTVLSQGVTVGIFLLFLLLEQRNERSGGVGGEVRERVKQYISVKVLTSAVTGIAVGLALWAVGAPMPMLFGLLTFLLNFIPTIGSVIAVALPLPLLLATDASTLTIVLALALPGAIQFAVGQIWENKLLGDAFDLRASVVLLALVFWGKIWGIVGMILATPIAAVLKTLMEGQELTRPLARLMGQAGGSAPDPADGAS